MSAPHKLKKRELLELVWSKPMTALASDFGLSPNGLAKICDRVDIERPPKGFWANGVSPDIEGLVGALDDPDEEISIGGRVSSSRRSRTRLPLEQRRRQVLEEARKIATTEGVHEVSLRQIARNLGISEAQAHNCYSTREDILVELAYEEYQAFERVRKRIIPRGTTRITKIVMSSVSYLREAARRGPLLQQISADSKLRKAIDERAKAERGEALARHVNVIVANTKLSEQQAIIKTKMMSAFVRKAGHLVAQNRISLEQAEILCVPVITDSALSD